MPWVPPEQRDTRWYLWHKLFRCRVSNIQTMSVEYLQEFGMPSSGDAQYDRETANELVQRMLSINQMVEFFRNGVTVGVCQVSDTKEIYERIKDHLDAWKLKLERSVNIRGAPVDDLVLLDRFATTVYKHARHHFTEQYVDSLLVRKMNQGARFNRGNILKALPSELSTSIEDSIREENEKKWPEHQSMADIFVGRHRQVTGGRKWK